MNKILNWIKNNKKEFWILIFILAVAAFCRLYHISDYMTFLGDEGRDVIIVRRLLVEGHPPLIGPGTSVGSMYLGPLYYYMMAPALLLANFSPVGPAIMIAILGVITVAFVWFVVREWFPVKTMLSSQTIGNVQGESLHIGALVAAALYSISPTIIYFSRSSWNPNIMPFFSLLSVYSIWKVYESRGALREMGCWLLVTGISFAFVLQSHYLGLLLAPTLFLFWILTFRNLKFIENYKLLIKNFLKKSLYSLLIFLGLMSPLLIFDIRHNWMNSRALYLFLTAKDPAVSVNLGNLLIKIPEIFNQITTSLLGAKNITEGFLISIIIGVAFATLLIRINRVNIKNLVKSNPAYYLLISWIGFGLIGLGLYRKEIYDHYFGFLFVVPFIFTGIFISWLLSRGKYVKIFGIGLLGCLIVINLMANPLLKDPNRLLQRSINVSKVIEKNSNGEKLNLAVIADTNYEAGYKYFLLKDNYPVIDIDAQIPGTITNQLFVVCELIPNSKCDPTHNAKAQVASFGWSKIVSSWEVDGAIVYRLVHSKP